MNSLRNGQVNMTKKDNETTSPMHHVGEEISKLTRLGVTPEALKAMSKSNEDIDNTTENPTPLPECDEQHIEITKDSTIPPVIQDGLQKVEQSSVPQQIITENKDTVEEEIGEEIESEQAIETINPKVSKRKTTSITTFSSLPSKYSIEEKIDHQTFSSKPFINNQKSKNFTYRLKSPEVEPFNDIMLLMRTTSPSETLRSIFEMVLMDYETAIREEATWKAEFRKVANDPEIEDITSFFDMENENFRKQRLIRMGFFTAPQRTRGDGIGKAIGCTIGQELIELIELLMVALDIDKPAPAYQWIMNVFVKDYAAILSKKTKKIKQAKAIFSGKNADT